VLLPLLGERAGVRASVSSNLFSEKEATDNDEACMTMAASGLEN